MRPHITLPVYWLGYAAQPLCNDSKDGPPLIALRQLSGGSVSTAAVQWTDNPATTLVQHMRIDHGGGYIGVAQQFLYRANIVATHEQMRRKTVINETHAIT